MIVLPDRVTRCADAFCGGDVEIVTATPDQVLDSNKFFCQDIVVRFAGGYGRAVCVRCHRQRAAYIPNPENLMRELTLAVALTSRELSILEERAVRGACERVSQGSGTFSEMTERKFRARGIRRLTEGDAVRRRECLEVLLKLAIGKGKEWQRITVTYDAEKKSWSVIAREFIPRELA